MTKKESKCSQALFLALAIILFAVGVFKCVDSTSMQSLKDSCTQDFDNISQSDCTTKYELMSVAHEEASLNAALFCFSIGALALISAISRPGQK